MNLEKKNIHIVNCLLQKLFLNHQTLLQMFPKIQWRFYCGTLWEQTLRYGFSSLLKALQWHTHVNSCVILSLSHWQSYHIIFCICNLKLYLFVNKTHTYVYISFYSSIWKNLNEYIKKIDLDTVVWSTTINEHLTTNWFIPTIDVILTDVTGKWEFHIT